MILDVLRDTQKLHVLGTPQISGNSPEQYDQGAAVSLGYQELGGWLRSSGWWLNQPQLKNMR